MSIENNLKDLISQLEAGYITREEFDVLKADLLSSKRQLVQSSTVVVVDAVALTSICLR